MGAVEKRLREEITKLRVEINEEKSRKVELSKGGSLGFLGFEYRRIRSRKQKWRAHYVPKLKKRTALLQKLKEIFLRYVSQPVGRVIELINPILPGWVHYFAVGDSSRCFSYINIWVEKKIRRHLMRVRQRTGFGWKRWINITLDVKHTGEPSAGNLHAGFDEAGAGNQRTIRLVRHSQRKRGATDGLNLQRLAPVLDPTDVDRRRLPPELSADRIFRGRDW